jgi:hypothetical protein
MWKRVESVEELGRLKAGTPVRILPMYEEQRWYVGEVGTTADGDVYGCFNDLLRGRVYADKRGYKHTWSLYSAKEIKGRDLDRWLPSLCTKHVEYVIGGIDYSTTGDMAMMGIFEKLTDNMAACIGITGPLLMPVFAKPAVGELNTESSKSVVKELDTETNKESKMRTYSITELKKQITEAAKKNEAVVVADVATKVREAAAKLADVLVGAKVLQAKSADDDCVEVTGLTIPNEKYSSALLELSLLSGDTVAAGDLSFDVYKLIQSAGSVTVNKVRLMLSIVTP